MQKPEIANHKAASAVTLKLALMAGVSFIGMVAAMSPAAIAQTNTVNSYTNGPVSIGNGNSLGVTSTGTIYSDPVPKSPPLVGVTIAAGVTATYLDNSGTIVAGNSLDVQGTLGTLTNQSTGGIGFGVMGFASGAGAAINVGTLGSIGAINNAGRIDTYNFQSGIRNAGSIGQINNASIIRGDYGIENRGNGFVSSMNNSGTIYGNSVGIYNWARVSVLTNSGFIRGDGEYGIDNSGSIGTLINSGFVSGAYSGITNSGKIDLLSNSGTITADDGSVAFDHSGTIGTLSNSGLIHGVGTGDGIYMYGGSASIGVLENSGTITSDAGRAIHVGASVGIIGILNNSGVISSGGDYAIYVEGASPTIASTIGAINNSGVISASAGAAIYSTGVIGSIVNSGNISGALRAIEFNNVNGAAFLGSLVNTGVISGGVFIDQAANSLTIQGGSGSVFGTFTGGEIAFGGPSLNSSYVLTMAGNNFLDADVVVASGYGTLTNTGTLMVNSTRVIEANFVQGRGATLAVGLTSATSGGRLDISGSAVMDNSNVLVKAVGGFRPVTGSTYILVDAATRSGTSYTNITPTIVGFQASLSTQTISGNYDLVLTVLEGPTGGGSSYTQIGVDSRARSGSMGVTLDRIDADTSAQATHYQQQVLRVIDALPAGRAQQNAIRQTAPTALTPAGLAFQMTSAPITSLVERHQLGLLAQGPGGPGVAAGSQGLGMQVWAQAMGGLANRATSSTTDGYRSSVGGFMMGLDWQAQPNMLVGAGVSTLYGRTLANGVTTGSATTLENYQFTAYGTWKATEQLYAYGQAGAGVNQFTQTRRIGFLGTSARASYGGGQYQTKAGVGYQAVVADNLTLTPSFGLNYVRANQAAYSETGAGVSNLRVNQSGADQLMHDLGVRASWNTMTSLGAVTMEGRLAWTHDYVSSAITTSGVLAGSAFNTTGRRIAPNGARINLAATLARTDNITVRAEYEGDIRADYNSHAGLIRASYGF